MKLSERMKGILDKSFENSKNFLEKAADKAKELGEKGILRYEINKLEKEVENKFSMVGSEVYSILIEKGQNTVSKNTPEIKDILLKIKESEELIAKKEGELKQYDEKE